MNNKAIGIIFICISAFLYGIRYLTAAIVGIYSPRIFEDLLSEFGKGPLIFSIISLIIGILCIIVPIIRKWLEDDVNKIKHNWEELDQTDNADRSP
jgi:ABC-type molybdate transport system permease subunit